MKKQKQKQVPRNPHDFHNKTLAKGDAVNHPSHYNSGNIEVIQAIEDWKLPYHEGNAVKYIARAGKKHADTFVQDLEKAIWYLNRKIQIHQAEQDGTVAARPDNTPIARSR